MQNVFYIGAEVTRLRGRCTYPSQVGKIVSIDKNNKAFIKWNEKSGNGQQHSTVDIKKLKIFNTQIVD